MPYRKIFTSIALIAAAIIVSGTLVGGAVAQETDARDLINRMAAEIAALDRFIISGEAYADARLGAGHIIQNASEVTMRVSKPDSMHMTKEDTQDTKHLYFNDGVLSIYTDPLGYYAQTEVPDGLGAAVDFAIDEIGIDAPLLDFVSKDMMEDLLADAEEVRHLGTSRIRGKLYDHVTIRSSEIDMQIWIASEGQTLPGKLVISSKWEGGSPRFVVFMTWNTDPEFSDDIFNFIPPAGATEINFLKQP